MADLKRELRARNIPITGTKQILVDRLLEAMSAGNTLLLIFFAKVNLDKIAFNVYSFFAEKSSNDNDSNIDDLLDEDSMLGVSGF